MSEQRLGVLGGMGPQATQVFYQFVLDRTDAARDQDHLPALILSDTGIPDRTAAILSGDTVRLFTIPYTTGRQLEDFRMTGKKEYGYGLGVRVRTESRDSLVPPGEFGWDGAAGAYVLADPLNKISIFYVQHVFGFPKAYSHIHPAIRDLAYGGIFGKTE